MQKRCAYCNGRFGLVRHSSGFKQFCSDRSGKRCKQRYLDDRSRRIEADKKRWLAYLAR